MQSGCGDGVSLIIKTQAHVDKNGKECNPLETPNARFIPLKTSQNPIYSRIRINKDTIYMREIL